MYAAVQDRASSNSHWGESAGSSAVEANRRFDGARWPEPSPGISVVETQLSAKLREVEALGRG
jgi:hypothetical protein